MYFGCNAPYKCILVIFMHLRWCIASIVLSVGDEIKMD